MLYTDLGGIYYLRFIDDLSDFKLTVDRTTGEVALANLGGGAVDLNSYSIQSDAGNLDPADDSWHSLDDQGIAGWHEASASSNALSGENSSGTTLILPAESKSMGTPYKPVFPGFAQSPVEDLEFAFELPGRAVVGDVEYVGEWLNTLVLHVDRATGNAVLQNPTEYSADLSAYNLISVSDSLDPDFVGLADQDVANWQVSDASSGSISETNTLGSTFVEAGGTFSFMRLFDPTGSEDLALEFDEEEFGAP